MVDFAKLNEGSKRRARLEKLIGMLGSDHEGEVLNAVRFIRKMAEDEKKTLAELLLDGKVVEKIVYRDPPMSNHPAARPYEQYRQPRYRRDWSDYNWDYEEPKREEKAEEKTAENLNDRLILDSMRVVLNSGELGCLDDHMQEFVRNVPFEYEYDWQLSNAQKKLARVIFRTWRKRNAEPLI